MKKLFISLSIASLVLIGSFSIPINTFAQVQTGSQQGSNGQVGTGSGSAQQGGTADNKTNNNSSGKSGLQITLENPLKSDNLEDFVTRVVGVLLKFLIPILAILFIITGFQLVTSGGDENARKKAKNNFLNLVIGAVLILGAWTFGNVIMNTLREVGILK